MNNVTDTFVAVAFRFVKRFCDMRLSVIVYVITLAIFAAAGEIRIRGKVKKRYTTHRRHRAILPPCTFNTTIIENEWALMEAIGKSKYIFTGKVMSVKKSKPVDAKDKRSNVYKVYMRRVLKGSLIEMRSFVRLEEESETLSGATIVVERPRARESCSPAPRPRLSAVFLSDGVFIDVHRPVPKLRLLTDPVPLTLYHLDRINAAVKGRQYLYFNVFIFTLKLTTAVTYVIV